MRFNLNHTRRAALAALAAACAIGALAACGSSGGSTAAKSASASGTTSTSTTPSSPAFGERIAKLRKCLHENGVGSQRRKPGTPPGQGLRGLQLPKGMSRAQYNAVLKKCGLGGALAGAGRRGLRNDPQFKAALSKFSACMTEHGIKLPPANSSGTGPVFNTKGVDTSSPQFKSAVAKCRPALAKAFPVLPGSGARAGAPQGAG